MNGDQTSNKYFDDDYFGGSMGYEIDIEGNETHMSEEEPIDPTSLEQRHLFHTFDVPDGMSFTVGHDVRGNISETNGYWKSHAITTPYDRYLSQPIHDTFQCARPLYEQSHLMEHHHQPYQYYSPNKYPWEKHVPPSLEVASNHQYTSSLPVLVEPHMAASTVDAPPSIATPKSPPPKSIASVYSADSTDTYTFQCDDPACKKQTFSRWYDFRRHFNGTHAAAPTVYWCDVEGCLRSRAAGDRPFPRKDKLGDHVEAVHGVREEDEELEA